MLSLSCAKCSVAWFAARLSPDTKHQYICAGTFWFSFAWGVSGALALSLRCDLNHPWINMGANCHNFLLRWQLIAAFDIVIEICLFLLIIYLVWGLQMSRLKKLVVILGFGFRLP